ncbi:hypothetical protein GX51_07439 [Blastomyces parvus]|uniref:N-acetyltransferase domain-containing protein n=1 Tax=Blastomyces parvus TaxID=2060905 RepID=A0A2B7WL28_9EURO|nr:hypothetical protein GX51_07439 [Blastomyces parvus]
MEGLRMSNHKHHLSPADEWSEMLASFKTLQTTPQSKYQARRLSRNESPRALSSKKDNTGLETPTQQERSNIAIINPPDIKTQNAPEASAALQAPSPKRPDISSPAKSNIGIANSITTDSSLKVAAEHVQETIRKEDMTSSGDHSSRCQSLVPKINSASNSDPDTEVKRAIAMPKNRDQEVVVLSPSPTGGSDKAQLPQYQLKYTAESHLARSTPAPPNRKQPARTVQSPHEISNGRSLTATNCSKASPPNIARGAVSVSANRVMQKGPISHGSPKSRQHANMRHRKPLMILNAPNDPSKGPLKKTEIDDKLERLQREGKMKILQQLRGIDPNAAKEPSPLDRARQGEGNDPTSPVAKEISLALTKRDITAFSPSLHDSRSGRNSSGDAGPDNVDSSDKTAHRTPFSERNSDYSEQMNKRQPIPGNDNPSMPVVDWQHRPWDSHSGQECTHRFKKWLKTIGELDRVWVDTDSVEFNDANIHFDSACGIFVSPVKPPITYLDLTDQKSAAHAHETASGYMHNWNSQLKRERQKAKWKQKQIAMQLSQQYRQPLAIEMNPHTPKLNLYLRPIETKDLPRLLKLFNSYIQNTVRCVDLEPLSLDSLQERIAECERERFPALVAVEQKPRLGHALNGEEEEIFGYILACDFSGPATINRYTAELELFVDPKYCRLGVGSCLVDKLLEICDRDYCPNQGYHFDCAAAQADVYRAGRNRQVARLVFILHHVADNDGDYQWAKEWLENKFGFQEQALLKGTGFKEGKWLNSSYLVRSIRFTPEEAEVREL